MKDRDQIYSEPRDIINNFAFDQSVVNVFPDMIQRSVPGYTTIINMIGQLSERYAQANSSLYDLGCSLGAATLAMRHSISQPGSNIVAIDKSLQMIEKCQAILAKDGGSTPVRLICGDITQTPITNASVCVLNFTLQFVPVEDRAEFIQRIANGLLDGGVLILSEKICFEDDEYEQLMVDLHHNFKRANGYSDMEIAQKRSALEKVLLPETLESHRERLLNAGFRVVNCWFQCFNFTSIIAFK